MVTLGVTETMRWKPELLLAQAEAKKLRNEAQVLEGLRSRDELISYMQRTVDMAQGESIIQNERNTMLEIDNLTCPLSHVRSALQNEKQLGSVGGDAEIAQANLGGG